MKQTYVGKLKGKELKPPKGSTLIPVDWLGTDVLVITTDKQRHKLAERMGLHPDDTFICDIEGIGGTASVIPIGGVPYFIMFLPRNERRIVIHESTHMVHMLFEYHGIPVNGENSEAVAYMTDHLCEQVFAVLEGNA